MSNVVNMAYLRVSRDKQSLERQIEAVKEWCPSILEEDIYKDVGTGADFNRNGIIDMIEKVKEYRRHNIDVCIYIHEITRLGRNYKETRRLLDDFEHLGVNIYCPDFKEYFDLMPEGFNETVMGQLLVRVVKEVLLAYAQQELEYITKRREEGYAIYSKKCEEQGIKRGRPSKTKDVDYDKFMVLYSHYMDDSISVEDILKVLEISKSKFYRLLKEWQLPAKNS